MFKQVVESKRFEAVFLNQTLKPSAGTQTGHMQNNLPGVTHISNSLTIGSPCVKCL